MSKVSEYVNKLLHDNCVDYPALFAVNVLHKDGLYNHLDRRAAYFEEYPEAEIWAATMKEEYLDLGLPFVIYIGLDKVHEYHSEQLVKCSVD